MGKPMFGWACFQQSQCVNYSSLINVLKGVSAGGYWLFLGDISLVDKELLSIIGEIVSFLLISFFIINYSYLIFSLFFVNFHYFLLIFINFH